MSDVVSSVSGAAYTTPTVKGDDDSELLSKEAFLTLLVTQMQYQDPLEPMDNSQMVSQMAQLSTMEAIDNLNTQFTVNAGLQSMSTALGMVGKQVTYTGSDGKTSATGVVDKVYMSGGEFYLEVDGAAVELSSVTAIEDAPAADAETTE